MSTHLSQLTKVTLTVIFKTVTLERGKQSNILCFENY
jgi:hypothetical protein